jgi:hypothetical protein
MGNRETVRGRLGGHSLNADAPAPAHGKQNRRTAVDAAGSASTPPVHAAYGELTRMSFEVSDAANMASTANCSAGCERSSPGRVSTEATGGRVTREFSKCTPKGNLSTAHSRPKVAARA